MIYYILEGHEFNNEVQTGIQIFYPLEKYSRVDEISSEGITVLSRIEEDFSLCRVYEEGKLICDKKLDKPHSENIKVEKSRTKEAVYFALSELTGYQPPWGILTGIRPTKLTEEFYSEGLSHDEAVEAFRKRYYVKENKASLAVSVYDREKAILDSSRNGSWSLYAGIPFCASRCLYCSFTSYPVDRYKNKIDKYIDCLIKEFEFTSKKLNDPETIYIGGGTPTALNEAQLDRMLSALEENFDTQGASEFTVEAGRPDTITEEKLEILKKHNVTRISVNPQTMNDKTLRLIGRRHTVSQIKETFMLAREKGFDNINMDLILGLPGEDMEDVRHTFSEIENLSPDSLTVHTLAVKRASDLRGTLEKFPLAASEEIEKMLDISADFAKRLNMNPYYMYRQKNMLGSFENVGYSREGKESLYNIKIMEETQSIIALGAGGVTKTVDRKTGRIERIFNVKSADDYIERIDEMLERKEKGLNLEVIL
ncbi:MAG: coproporphyrinogen dehydrogenase HemZ [Firmicutes bacterium]|nr:coproporphyrinogen dehydrogenase HemZ [Bacillota bacterium]